MKWVPLESNPEVMNSWATSLGLPASRAQFVDVFSLEDWGLDMIPKPVYAVLLLFPVTKAYEEERRAQAARLREESEKGGREGEEERLRDLVYFKQTIGNACGTMGLLHAIGNSGVQLDEGPLTELFQKCKGKVKHPSLPEDSAFFPLTTPGSSEKSPVERAQLLEEDRSIEEAHNASAQSGQTRAPAADESVDLHFVTFVAWPPASSSTSSSPQHLIELDGRKDSPIDHGAIKDDFLRSAAEVIQRDFMAKAKDAENSAHENAFSLAALAQAVEQ